MFFFFFVNVYIYLLFLEDIFFFLNISSWPRQLRCLMNFVIKINNGGGDVRDLKHGKSGTVA